MGFYAPFPVPWDNMSMDFVLWMPMAQQGNEPIFMVVKKFSKMTLFIPFKNTSDSTGITIFFSKKS